MLLHAAGQLVCLEEWHAACLSPRLCNQRMALGLCRGLQASIRVLLVDPCSPVSLLLELPLRFPASMLHPWWFDSSGLLLVSCWMLKAHSEVGNWSLPPWWAASCLTAQFLTQTSVF